MPGPSDADRSPSFGAFSNVASRCLGPCDSSQILAEGSLQDLGRTMSSGRLQNVIDERENALSQGCVPLLENADAPVPILRAFLAYPGITPMMPEHTQRYSNRPKLTSDSIQTGMTVEMWTNQQIKPMPPFGWVEIVHPEGGRYFFNQTKRAYTDANLHNLEHFRKATSDLAIIENFMAKNGITLPESCHLVFDLFVTGETIETKYYFVNHQRKSIFFLDSYVVEPWIDTPGRLGHEIEGQYWYHLNVYPDSLKLSLSMVRELKDMTIHLIGDKMTASNGSNAPYSIEDLRRILDSTIIIENSISSHDSIGAMSFVSRIMYIYSRSRFWDYAGEAHARIERGQSVYDTVPKRRHPKVKKIIFVALFGIPEPYLKSIEKLWVDQMVFHLDWIQLLKQRVGEWNNYILTAAIMLNVNIPLLVGQSLMPSQGTHYEVGAHILSSLSFLANCACIFSGFFLVRQTPRDPTAQKLHAYLSRHENRWLGIDSLAILHSLPYAFLVWGFVLLLAAFYIFSFRFSGFGNVAASIGLSLAFLALALWVRSDWDDPAETSTAEDQAAASENKTNTSQCHNTSSTSALSPWRISMLLKARRNSYDSQNTAV